MSDKIVQFNKEVIKGQLKAIHAQESKKLHEKRLQP